MGKCMGLSLNLARRPSPRRLHWPDNGLPAGVDGDVLHRHLQLALAAVAVQSLQQDCTRTGELVGLAEVFATPSKVCSASMARR